MIYFSLPSSFITKLILFILIQYNVNSLVNSH